MSRDFASVKIPLTSESVKLVQSTGVVLFFIAADYTEEVCHPSSRHEKERKRERSKEEVKKKSEEGQG